jgi:hypothetical protein
MQKWGVKDGDFNLSEFYHLIIKVLGVEDDEWVDETMDWWQRYVCQITIETPELDLTLLHTKGRSLVTRERSL